MVKAVKKGMRGAPEPGAPAPATGHSPRIPFLTAFTIDFLRFEVHFSCPVWVLRRDSFGGRVWYGNRLIYLMCCLASRAVGRVCGVRDPPLEFLILVADFLGQRLGDPN